ncbi:MAG: ATP-binding cassette domain-containing protein, partial [Anaerolineae bacterium]
QRSQASEEAFVQAMVGQALDVQDSLLFSRRAVDSPPPAADRTPILQVQNLGVRLRSGAPLLQNCTFQIQPGEIFGVAGVAGNGQRPLAEAIMGIRSPAQGRALVAGVDVSATGTVKLLENLVTYIPEDRVQDGYLPTANVAQNLILGFHRRTPYSRNGFLNWKSIFQTARRLIAEYNIMTPGPDDLAAHLSGGNIQRVMIARAFSYPSKLVVAHNPSRGLDIPSMEFVYGKLLARKAEGGATLLISEDLDELLLLCDRIATLYRGQVVGILPRSDFDKYKIGRMMSGVDDGL